ncbi:MAG: DNA-directed RNA polymerase subunit delta [Erysipelotrichaceae bacterium]|nr:DNA-directed RNA polymerase subunit delta [Erysipelotrichaceae bacterium]
MENISQMSLLEVAVKLMEQKRTVQNIKALIKEVLEMKGLSDEDGELTTQLYIDITTSSKFVYMGNDEWDLKSRQSLDEYDKDGSAFNSKDEEFFDDEEELNDEDDLDEDDLDDDDDDDSDDEEEYDDESSDLDDEDDLDDDDDDSDYDDGELEDEDMDRYTEEGFNEDKYNNYMDDYEDMYDEN